jgi:hypothetical protein
LDDGVTDDDATQWSCSSYVPIYVPKKSSNDFTMIYLYLYMILYHMIEVISYVVHTSVMANYVLDGQAF